jgi:hypothetical protein
MKNQITPTGLKFLDKQLGGGLSNGINVIGSQSGVGKTSFSMMLCKKLHENNYNVLHLAFEDSANLIVDKYYRSKLIYNLNNTLYVQQITNPEPTVKEIVDVVNEITYDIILLDAVMLEKNKFDKLIGILSLLNKPIILTTQLIRDSKLDLTSIRNDKLKYSANNILILEHQDKKNSLLKISVPKTRYGCTTGSIKNVYFNNLELECEKLSRFKLFFMKIFNFIIRCIY